MTLHDELGQLAGAAPRPTIDHSVWDRGRALRRRDRLVTTAAVLAMVVILGGVAALVLSPQRSVDPADDPMPDGAIPSRIEDVTTSVTGPLETDLAIGRVSVAFLAQGSDIPVVIGATDGTYHLLDLPGIDPDSHTPPAVSPDGTQLAWADSESNRIRLVDFETGQLSVLDGLAGTHSSSFRWSPDGETLFSLGLEIKNGRVRAGRIDLRTGRATPLPATLANESGFISPDGTLYAVPGGQEQSTQFLRKGSQGELEREFSTDIYPDGVAVLPVGWTDDSLVLATASTSTGSEAGGRHLILFTAPSRPQSEWTFRVVARDLPLTPITVAVDLIPDLDGTSSQQLTRDFGEPDGAGDRDISWLIGLGVAGALTVLYALRWLWRRRTLLR